VTPIAVSVDEAAALLNVSPTTMRSYIEQGLIPVVKLPSARHQHERSRRVHVAVSDIEIFVQQHRVVEAER
jgi:excisionase family DNA binding protein